MFKKSTRERVMMNDSKQSNELKKCVYFPPSIRFAEMREDYNYDEDLRPDEVQLYTARPRYQADGAAGPTTL
jgi:hypothetical protein